MSEGTDAAMPNLAQVAKALADDRRAQLVLTLIDGRAWTPTELATCHRWPRSSVTEHLNVLIAAGLIQETRQGKHRYVRLADADTAETIERLAAVSPVRRPTQRTLRAHCRSERLRAARTCYHHLAGRLGVHICQGLLRAGLVSSVNGYLLTAAGWQWFEDLGYPIRQTGPHDRRPIVRPCLDWTERVDHLAGTAPDTLCSALIDLGWILRTSHDRTVQLTQVGKTELTRLGLLDDASNRSDDLTVIS